METRKAKLGLFVYPGYIHSASSLENLMPYISEDCNMNGRILLTLKEYLEKYSKVFNETQIIVTGESDNMPNGNINGLISI